MYNFKNVFKNNKIYIIAAASAAAIVILSVVFIAVYSMLKNDLPPEPTADLTERSTASAATVQTADKTDSVTTNSSGASKSEYSEALDNYLSLFKSVPQNGTVTKSADDIGVGYQILVNNDYIYNVDQPHDLQMMTDVEDRAFTVAYTDLDADRFTLRQFNQMNTAYYNEYGDKLNVCSGYRSYKSQKRLFDNSVASVGEEETLKWYTRPGHSEHHTGFSIDYNTNSFGDSAFTGTGNESYIRNNCKNYGFILRYTAEKKPVTGVAAEAWHFRQVGIPHAIYIMDNNLCLEEYITEIKSYSYEKPLSITTAGGEYTFYVWYVQSVDGGTEIPLSGYSKYTVSGNNVDGFIVTALK